MAMDDALLKFNLNAETYAKGIPEAELLPLSKGGHFVFMPECTFMGKVFTYFHRFDICGRRGNVVEARPELHAQVAQAAKSFLDAKLSKENNMVRRAIEP